MAKNLNQRELLREEKRRGILEAALHVFAERGFHQATMDEVAERGEISKGAIYLHYRNKDDLFFSLLEQKMAESEKPLGEAMQQGSTLSELVQNVVSAQLGFLESNQEFFRIFSSEQIRFDQDFQGDFRKLLKKKLNSYIDDLAKALGRFLDTGREDASLARDLALCLIGMMNAHTTNWIINHDPEPLTRKIDLIAQVFLQGAESVVEANSSTL